VIYKDGTKTLGQGEYKEEEELERKVDYKACDSLVVVEDIYFL